jgi:hypothetical protein
VLAALCLAAILFLVRNVSQLSNPKESIDTLEIKNILYYTPFWNHKDYGFGLGTDCSKASVINNYEDNSWAFVVITCLFA